MAEYYHTFIQLLFIGVIALFPVINPLGTAFIINPYFSNLTKAQKKKAVTKITLYAFCICTVSLFAGHWILELFGLTIPVIQLGGGIMICKMGWEFLSSDQKPEEQDTIEDEEDKSLNYAHIQDKLFYPITFPVTTGAGTMSVLFTLSAHSANEDITHYLINTGALLLAIIIMCVLIYFLFLETKHIIHYLGSNGERLINRITAFLIFCVGIQIAVAGIKSLIKG